MKDLEGLSDLFWMLFVPDSPRPHRQTARTDSRGGPSRKIVELLIDFCSETIKRDNVAARFHHGDGPLLQYYEPS